MTSNNIQIYATPSAYSKPLIEWFCISLRLVLQKSKRTELYLLVNGRAHVRNRIDYKNAYQGPALPLFVCRTNTIALNSTRMTKDASWPHLASHSEANDRFQRFVLGGNLSTADRLGALLFHDAAYISNQGNPLSRLFCYEVVEHIDGTSPYAKFSAQV